MSARLSRLIAFFFMLFSSSIASAEDYNNPYNFSVEEFFSHLDCRQIMARKTFGPIITSVVM